MINWIVIIILFFLGILYSLKAIFSAIAIFTLSEETLLEKMKVPNIFLAALGVLESLLEAAALIYAAIYIIKH